MAYIYLGQKSDAYECKGIGVVDSTVIITKELYDKCCNFQVVKYKIEYSSSYNSSQTTTSGSHLYICTGYSDPRRFHQHDVTQIYSYFPDKDAEIVIQVDLYYILNDNRLFALVFTTKDGKKKFCKYDKLERGLNRKALPGTEVKDWNLCEFLHDYSEKSHDCKTFRFILGSHDNTDVGEEEQNVDTDCKFRKVVFFPDSSVDSRSKPVLYSNNLFTLKAKNGLENKIDVSCLDSVKNLYFNSVIVYYTGSAYGDNEGLAILIEFVNYCRTTHIKRIANNPPVWFEAGVYYDYDGGLMEQLGHIKEGIEAAITYELKKNNNDYSYKVETIKVEVTSSDSEYTIYTHTPADESSEKQTIPYYNGKQIKITPNSRIDRDYKADISDGDSFNKISTYSLNTSTNEHLLIRLTSSTNINYYLHRFNNDGSQWRHVDLDFLKDAGIDTTGEDGQSLDKKLDYLLNEKSQSTNVKALLTYISLCVKSIIVLLDKKETYGRFDINPLIINGIPPIDVGSNSINITYDNNVTTSNCLKLNGYKVYKHHLGTAGRTARRNLDGSQLYLRFYLDGNMFRPCDKNTSKHTPLEYHQGANDLYVYFYGDDPRPLAFCYGNQVYRPNSKDEYGSKWIKEREIKQCDCRNSFNCENCKQLLNALSRVIGFLNVVDLETTTISLYEPLRGEVHPVLEEPDSEGKISGKYDVHSPQMFGLISISIKVTHENKICYRVYTHTPNGINGKGDGYRLGEIKYKDSTLNYDITKQLYKVGVYYNVYDGDHQYPLLVVLDFKRDDENTDVEYHKLKNKSSKEWEKIKSSTDDSTQDSEDSSDEVSHDYDDKSFLQKLRYLYQPQEKMKQELEEIYSEVRIKLLKAIEKEVDNIRTDLGIQFNDEERAKPLFNPKDCKEGINIPAVVGGTVGTAAVIGTAATAGVVVSKTLAASTVATAAASGAAAAL